MMPTDADRIRRLERALWVLGLGLLVTVGIAVLAVYRASQPAAPPPTEISLDGLTLSKWGMNVEHEVAPKRHSGARLEATDAASYLSLGIGRLGMTIALDAKSNTVRFETRGNVESTIEANTDTGEWTLVRTLHDAKYDVIKEDRLPLVSALKP
ncbi:MAG: hypothetical protein ABJE66_17855 [Deltaproteobacteria bacterium]